MREHVEGHDEQRDGQQARRRGQELDARYDAVRLGLGLGLGSG